MTMRDDDVRATKLDLNYTNVASTVAGAFGIGSAGTTVSTGWRIRVLGVCIMGASSGTAYFGADTAVSTIGSVFGNSTAPFGIGANGGFVLPVDPFGVGWFQTAANTTAGAVHLNFVANTTGPWAGTVVWTKVR